MTREGRRTSATCHSVHVLLQARPNQAFPSVLVRVAGEEFCCVQYESVSANDCLPFSFEQVLDHLQQLPRMFVEPDGSWVWVSPHGSTDWQLDGQLHDGPVGLMSVEVKGRAPLLQWEALLPCLGWPDAPLLFQLVQEGLYLDEDTFRVYLTRSGKAR